MNLSGRSRRNSAERDALFEGLDGVDEGEPGEPVDVLDDVTAGAAPEAMEPVRYAANGQRRRGVVVERATAHEPVPAARQLDTTCRHNGFDPVTGSNCRNVKVSPA